MPKSILIEEDFPHPRKRSHASIACDHGRPWLDQRYVDYLLSTLVTPLTGLRIAIDSGNGAASHLAPDLFRRAGAEVIAIHNQPDGRNINLNCGALHVESLRDEVLRSRSDAGVAFDGDADRAILVSGSGKIIDGDALLLIAAGAMPHNTVVATVMSNLGLEKPWAVSAKPCSARFVGDKYVLEEMLVQAMLGGEQSGHVISSASSRPRATACLQLFVYSKSRARPADLDALTSDLEIYPQRLVNVRIKQKRPLDQLPEVSCHIAEAERFFDGSGRVLVRFGHRTAGARHGGGSRPADVERHCSASPRPSAANWRDTDSSSLCEALLFNRFLFDGNRVIPWDFRFWHLPHAVFIADAIRDGEFPLWNPYLLRHALRRQSAGG